MKLEIRKATIEDCRSIYSWRTSPINSASSFTGSSFSYEDHTAWFTKYLEDTESLMLIVSFNDKPCCVLRFDGDWEEKTVSIYMVPSFHGFGLGIQCLLLGERYLKEELQGLRCNLIAEIMMDNKASFKLFSRAGYIYSMADWHKVI